MLARGRRLWFVLPLALLACGGDDDSPKNAANSGGAGGAKGGTGGTSTTGGSGGTAGNPSGGAGGASGSGGAAGSGGLPPTCPLPALPADAIDVTKSGATPDDASDDTAAIQSVIDQAGAGSTVYLPDGNYRIQACPVGVSLKSDITFLMAPNAVLEAIPNDCEDYAILRASGVSNLTIAGGTLRGERAGHSGTSGEWGHGLDLDSTTGVSVIGVAVKDCWGDGFYLGGSNNQNTSICGVVTDNVRRNGISIVAGDGITIASSTFSNTNGTLPESGLDIEPNEGQSVKNVTISDCHFESNKGDGLQVTQVTGTVGAIKLTGNAIKASGGYGVLLEAVDVVFDANTVDGGTWGIVVNKANVTVSGNTVTNSQRSGIIVQYDGQSSVVGNIVKDAADHGIVIDGTASNVTIESNQVEGSGRSGSGFDNIRLEGSASQNTVKSNTCRIGSNASQPDYGIRIAAPECSANQILNNDLVSSGASGSFSDQGTGTVSSGNKL